MPTLRRSARGLLVALAALALTGGAVFAARGLPSAATPGTQQAATASGRTTPSIQAAGVPTPNGTPEAKETPEPVEPPDAEDNGASSADRPHNHGWTVSQAANADTPAGFANHGAYVSSIAKGDAGKPDAAASAADHAAAGKATGAAAKAAHQH